jgi:hypothetical protein
MKPKSESDEGPERDPDRTESRQRQDQVADAPAESSHR